jgi:hypothetical protein
MKHLLERVFSGHYSFERRISSPQLSITGTATFENGLDNQILYLEEGQYRLEGVEQIYYQKRIFVVDQTGVYIYKNVNSLLHEFRVDNMQTLPIKLTHTHHCKDDQYSMTMVIHLNNSFSMAYVVKGPSKDYRIDTVFTRLIEEEI